VPRSRFHPRHPWLGALCAGAGLFIVAVAAGLVPAPEDSFHAPRWVLGVCGGVFVLGGALMVLGDRPRTRDALAALLLAGMGTAAVDASLFADAAHLSGGVPLLGRGANVLLARVVFGGGALVCFVAAAYSARSAWRGP
jgi:hypothetical protein